MLTFKLKIKNTIDVTDYCINYSYMYRKLFSNFYLSEDKTFEKELREKYKLHSWIYQSCKIEVKAHLNKHETYKNKQTILLNNLHRQLEIGIFKGTKGKRYKYKILKRISEIKLVNSNKIIFGSRHILSRISFLSNDKEKNKEEISRLKKQYYNNRIRAISIVGESDRGGNRKFDFDFENKKLGFKPIKGIVIPVEFFCSNKQYEYLCKLGKIITQPISIRLNNDYVWITFDEERLHGYDFNKIEYFKELKSVPKEHKVERKAIYKKWINEQQGRKFTNKHKNRFLSVDLNPEHIGICIIEKNNNKFNILHKEVISFEKLNKKLGLKNNNPIQIHQNKKRIHELYEAWKYIFNQAKYYKVGNFSIENLEFKDKGINNDNTETNRKVKRIWHRDLTTTSIEKYCNIFGINLIKVNAAYSSFIGNIQHDYYDPLASAIEIGRRGITRYLKGGFYPAIERSDFDTMYRLGLDVQNKTVSNWIEAYKLFKTEGLRYRREPKNFVEINHQSHKSNVKRLRFL